MFILTKLFCSLPSRKFHFLLAWSTERNGKGVRMCIDVRVIYTTYIYMLSHPTTYYKNELVYVFCLSVYGSMTQRLLNRF